MRLNEINFSFGGRHCLRDFGCIYVEKSGHPATPAKTPNEYEIAGLSGTVRMGGETYDPMTFSGTLFFVDDPPSQAEAQRRIRQISRWLLAGRQRLIFDYEPDRYYMAEVASAGQWSYSEWIEGGLSVELSAQPFARSLQPSSVQQVTTAAENAIELSVSTGEPAPLRVTVANAGGAVITGVTVSVNGACVALTDALSVEAGDSVTIDMEPPAGALYGASGGSALPCASRFDYIALPAGRHTIGVTLAFGASGTPGAKITASARGRWL